MHNALVRKLTLSIGALATAALLAPAALAGDCGKDPVYARDTVGKPTVGLRVRSIACMEGSKILTVIPAGTSVKVIGETDGWYKVKIGDTVGWMGAAYMTVSGEAKTATVNTATELLGKKQMVGILEKDFEKVKLGNKELASRLKDKVLLRVQKRGETWYVEKDGVLTQVKHLGKNEFKRLNAAAKAEKKVEKEVKKEEKKAAVLPPAGSITLAAEVGPGHVSLKWTPKLDAAQGFKIVKSTDPSPEYPGDAAVYVNGDARAHELWLDGNKTYYIRVCRYTGSGCDSYSNEIKVFVPAGEKVEKESTGYSKIDSELVLKASTLPGAVALEWTKCTSGNFEGYKIVRSESDPDLYYPKSGYIEYLSDRETLYHIDGTATPGKTYYYRVCARESGEVASCGNVVKVTARQR